MSVTKKCGFKMRQINIVLCLLEYRFMMTIFCIVNFYSLVYSQKYQKYRKAVVKWEFWFKSNVIFKHEKYSHKDVTSFHVLPKLSSDFRYFFSHKHIYEKVHLYARKHNQFIGFNSSKEWKSLFFSIVVHYELIVSVRKIKNYRKHSPLSSSFSMLPLRCSCQLSADIV